MLAYYTAGAKYDGKGNFLDALKCFKKTIELAQKDPPDHIIEEVSYFMIGSIHSQDMEKGGGDTKHNYDNAIEAFQQAKNQPSAYMCLAKICMRRYTDEENKIQGVDSKKEEEYYKKSIKAGGCIAAEYNLFALKYALYNESLLGFKTTYHKKGEATSLNPQDHNTPALLSPKELLAKSLKGLNDILPLIQNNHENVPALFLLERIMAAGYSDKKINKDCEQIACFTVKSLLDHGTTLREAANEMEFYLGDRPKIKMFVASLVSNYLEHRPDGTSITINSKDIAENCKTLQYKKLYAQPYVMRVLGSIDSIIKEAEAYHAKKEPKTALDNAGGVGNDRSQDSLHQTEC